MDVENGLLLDARGRIFVQYALSSCTAVGNFVDSFDVPPEITSPCVGTQGSPCGPKRIPDRQWLMNYHGLNIPV